MNTEKMQAIVFGPLETLARLLSEGDVSGEAAGGLLALVLAGARAELADRAA